MPQAHPLLNGIHETALGHFMVDQSWFFSVCETLHFFGLSLLMGSLLIVDLRLMDFMKGVPVRLALRFVPFAIAGLVINVVTGICFYASNPQGYWTNWLFVVKMGLVVLATANALYFTFVEEKHLLALPEGAPMPRGTKIFAFASLLLWTLVLIAGRALPATSDGNG
jgi:hypothetical protein